MSIISLAVLAAGLASSSDLSSHVSAPCTDPDRIEITLENSSAKPIKLHRSRLPWAENASSIDIRPFSIRDGKSSPLPTMAPPVSYLDYVSLEPGQKVSGIILLSHRIQNFESHRRNGAVVIQLTIAEGFTRGNEPGAISRWLVHYPKQGLFSRECPAVLELK